MRLLAALTLAAHLAGCGVPPTEANAELLAAALDDDLAPEQRARLTADEVLPKASVSFPDGQVALAIEVTAARMAAPQGDAVVVDKSAPPRFLRAVRVSVERADGHVVRAELAGNPVNIGTRDVPIHSRQLLITRERRGLFGTTLSQMMVQLSPRGAERVP